MRTTLTIGFAAILAAATPALGQVIVQTPGIGPSASEQRAQQDRLDAHMARDEAQRRAAVGDYEGAADAQRDARHDWHDARRQEDRAQDAPATSSVIISR